jgi:L-ascorbate metabolism protein UlaG (beta-lactamase superfamily)
VKIKDALRWLKISAVVLLAISIVALLVVRNLWQDRAALSDMGLPTAGIETDRDIAVTVTWLGISSLLFDDGETQILIDGTFTRVSPWKVMLPLPISSDVAAINHALTTFRINRLAAIIPVHSHFDHAMDIGFVANRTTAVVLGSESTANIARGAEVPVDQYQILASGETRQFGDFTIRLIASKHAPIGPRKQEWFAGTIDEPLTQPARASAWKTGVAWSVFIEHPRGSSLIQASGGFIEGRLHETSADVVMLGIGSLASLDEKYVQTYWNETVVATGARRVIAIHHDDYTAPFGTTMLFPKIADNAVQTAAWIVRQNNASGHGVIIELPPFGQAIPLY